MSHTLKKTVSKEPGCTSEDNRRRIRSAGKVVRAYPAYDEYDLQSSAVDLVADVLTWAAHNSLSVPDILRIAYDHYRAEGGIQ